MVSLKVNSRLLQKAMKRAPRALGREMAIAFDRHGLIFEGYVKANLFKGRPGLIGRRGTGGGLAGTVGHTRPDRGRSLAGLSMRLFIGGPANPYAHIQEDGGVVRPKKGQYLTVPLPDNLTAGGVPRFPSARELMSTGKTFIAKSRAGNLIIGLRTGEGQVSWLWILKRSVTIPPRLGFVKAFNSRAMRRDRKNRIDVAIRKALRGEK